MHAGDWEKVFTESIEKDNYNLRLILGGLQRALRLKDTIKRPPHSTNLADQKNYQHLMLSLGEASWEARQLVNYYDPEGL